MLPKVENLTVSLFDFHLWESPLIDAACLNPAVQFLGNPAEYRKMRITVNKLELTKLRVFPLIGELDHNHFWRRYAQAAKIMHLNAASAICIDREWLLPLRCRPTSLDLYFQVTDRHLVTKAYATIWLWSFGWSSNVEFTLRLPLSFDDVQAIAGSLHPGVAKPFVLAGSKKSLPEVFRFLTQQLKGDLSGSEKIPHDTLELPRRIIMSIVVPKNTPPQRYGNTPLSLPRWSDSERARMHGALLGRDVTVQKVVEWENNDSLLTHLLGTNFALTHPKNGTLLMLRDPTDGRRRDKHRCLTANIRSCWLSIVALVQLTTNVKERAADNHSIANLVAAGDETLAQIEKYYKNPVCWTLVKHLKPS